MFNLDSMIGDICTTPPSRGVRIAEDAVGIEVEVENAIFPGDITADTTSWRVTVDGSLRNDGVEFISRPLSGRYVGGALEMLYRWWDRYEFGTSLRTSTHVHCNMYMRSVEQVSAVTAVYALLEPLLFAFCGFDREQNVYCVPWYRTRQPIEQFYSGNVPCKYSALSLASLWSFGTIEFRQAPAFDSLTKMRLWVDVVKAIADSWRIYPNAEAVIDDLRDTGISEVAQRVLGDTNFTTLSRYRLVAEEDETYEEYAERVDAVGVALYCAEYARTLSGGGEHSSEAPPSLPRREPVHTTVDEALTLVPEGIYEQVLQDLSAPVPSNEAIPTTEQMEMFRAAHRRATVTRNTTANGHMYYWNNDSTGTSN